MLGKYPSVEIQARGLAGNPSSSRVGLARALGRRRYDPSPWALVACSGRRRGIGYHRGGASGAREPALSRGQAPCSVPT
jgi:hypothetical protein